MARESQTTQAPPGAAESDGGRAGVADRSLWHRMSALPRRLATSALLVLFVVGTLFWSPPGIYAIVVMVFIAAGLYEFFGMAASAGLPVRRRVNVVLGLSWAALAAWASASNSSIALLPMAPLASPSLSQWLALVFWPVVVMVLCLRYLMSEHTEQALAGVSVTVFGIGYVAGLFSYFFPIRWSSAGNGAWLVFFLILVTKMADAGAYILGNLIGRHPLMPRISPKKTIEGLIGAMLASTLSGLLAARCLPPPFGPLEAALLGLSLGILGQAGDLVESLLKRSCHVKDTGRLMPGLGGVLDVIDSLLFTAPVFHAVISVWSMK